MSTRAKPAKPKLRTRSVVERPVQLEIRTEDLPPGICGRVQGIALPYGVRDYYRTRFKKGCLDRTRNEKVAAGKVKLLADHMGITRCHVGVVRQMPDVGDAAAVVADLFDTEAGRSQLEYCKAVVAAGAVTGFSVGFYHRAGNWETDEDGVEVYEYTEIELDEVSLTPSPAVPGAQLTGVRNTDDTRELLRVALGTILDSLPEQDVRAAFAARFGHADAEDTGDADPAPTGARSDSRDADAEDSQRSTPAPAAGAAAHASEAERLRVIRRSYAPVHTQEGV